MKNLTELKADLHKAEKQLAAADFEEGKKFAQAKIDRLTKEIEAAEKASSTSAPAKKKDKAKTAVHGKNSKKTALKKASVEYNGKVYYEGDSEYCDVLQKITDERLEKAKKANKQHKTKPISISVGETLTHAVEKAVNNISAEDAKKYSKRYVVALRTIKKQFTGLLGSFKTLLGEDYDREEIKQAIDVINEMIEDIQENVSKKMANGGLISVLKAGDVVKFIKKSDKKDIINGKILDINENQIGFENLDYPNVGRNSFSADSLRKHYDVEIVKNYSSGGGIENQYEDKSAGEVWDSWTTTQRMHFLSDHIKDKQHTPATIEEYTKKSYKFLPQDIKYLVLEHTLTGEYATGGTVGGRGFFGFKKGEKITDVSKIKKGDIILEHSKQFNTDNTFKIVNRREYGDTIQLDAIYWNPETKSRIGNEDIGISQLNIDSFKDEFWFPK